MNAIYHIAYLIKFFVNKIEFFIKKTDLLKKKVRYIIITKFYHKTILKTIPT